MDLRQKQQSNKPNHIPSNIFKGVAAVTALSGLAVAINRMTIAQEAVGSPGSPNSNGSKSVAAVKASGTPEPLRTAPAMPTHPLDPLTASEFTFLKQILQKAGFSENTVYGWVQLKEPTKEEVLAHIPGKEFTRHAFVSLISPETKTAHEVIVDLKSGTIVSKVNLGNLQPPINDWDFTVTNDAINASSELKTALKKRGYSLEGKMVTDILYVDPYAPGVDFTGEGKSPLTKNGKTVRAMRVLFADRQGGKSDYGPYLEGLMAIVDLYSGKVVKVYDQPNPQVKVKVPHDIFDAKVRGANPNMATLELKSPNIKDLKINGNHVQWGEWNFRFSFNGREGLVLHQIGHLDNGRTRSVCYRASLSEILVPYAHTNSAWLWREFFDSGEYGIGYNSTSVRPGKEIPNNALVIDAILPDITLKTKENCDKRVFFYERDGGPLVSHVQWTDGSRIYARGKELVTGFVVTLGNYDYFIQWVFRQDGSFGFEADLNGLIENRTIARGQKCDACNTQRQNGPGTYLSKGDQAYGSVVSEQLLGVNHQHSFSLRLDFDIDGRKNAFKEINLKPLHPQNDSRNPARRAYNVETTVFGTEHEAQRNYDTASQRSWVVYNPESVSPAGHPAGYQIQAPGNVASMISHSRFGENISFVQRQVWATRYNRDEIYAAGRYPNQAPSDYRDNLSLYSSREAIYGTDNVIWLTLTKTHLPKPEDFPIMPGRRVTASFQPVGFFSHSPAVKYGKVEPAK